MQRYFRLVWTRFRNISRRLLPRPSCAASKPQRIHLSHGVQRVNHREFTSSCNSRFDWIVLKFEPVSKNWKVFQDIETKSSQNEVFICTVWRNFCVHFFHLYGKKSTLMFLCSSISALLEVWNCIVSLLYVSLQNLFEIFYCHSKPVNLFLEMPVVYRFLLGVGGRFW